MMELPHQMREAWELQDHLDALVLELDGLSKKQDDWSDRQEALIDLWEPIFDDFSEQLQQEYDEGDHKGAFPSKERLDSMVRRANPQNRELWRKMRHADRQLEKLNRRASAVAKIIGGLQSELKTLGEEVRAPRPAREPEGELYGRMAQ
jgi:hypothetical protein